MASLKQNLHEIINQSTKIEDGAPTRYHLKHNADEKSEQYRIITYGERDSNKPHKTILMVGETGIGKTKLINVMINYMLGVQREDRVWFEITDDQSDRTSAQSQTSIITVYGFYLQESPIDLTIIDTPGYGDMRADNEKMMRAMCLLKLIISAETIHQLDAVCLVIKASQNRLSDQQIYIFDAVQSLFGKDVAENIVLVLTHSRGVIPKNALTAVKVAKIKCAVDDKNQPVYFLFDNCQSDSADEQNKMMEDLWNLSFREINFFFEFLVKIKPKSMQMTQDTLEQRKELEENILKIKSNIQQINTETQESNQGKEQIEYKKNHDDESEVPFKEMVVIDPAIASVGLHCTICEENSHYPRCWWVRSLSWCCVMKKNHCTICTKKCHYSKHVNGAPIYLTKANKEQITKENSKKYDAKTEDCVSKIKNMEELQELKLQKMKLVIEAFHCVRALEMIALNTDSLITLQHVDFLIDELKKINEHEKAQTLENIKKRAGEEKNKVLEYLKRCIK
ncbi:uncharacterized protein [Garra rufa]|uniref:uncharacterized protein n=1 Tax=Garra rufa TaxID=137080 RepID=UPI003CCEA977